MLGAAALPLRMPASAAALSVFCGPIIIETLNYDVTVSRLLGLGHHEDLHLDPTLIPTPTPTPTPNPNPNPIPNLFWGFLGR